MKQDREGAGYRHGRLERLILDELRALLREDVSDPALVDARITSLVLSVDYRHARVHFALRGGGSPDIALERARVERAFERATPFLRAQLADAIEIKRVPDLRFVFDGVVIPEDTEEPCE
ncbi:MAG: ribosome-binding factor A [Polyangiaceae bacterium]